MSLSTFSSSNAIPFDDVSLEKINLSDILAVPTDAEVRVDANTQLIDIVDALTIILGNRKTAHKHWERYRLEKSEQVDNLSTCSLLYWRKGGHPSAVAPAHVIVQIINQLNSKKAAHFRTAVAKDFCRKLGGDLTLANEIFEQNASIAGTTEQSLMLNDTGTTLEEANTGVKRPRDPEDELAQQIQRIAKTFKALTDSGMTWPNMTKQYTLRAQNLSTLLLTDQSSDDSRTYPVVFRPWTAVEIALNLKHTIPPNGEIGLGRAVAKAYRQFYCGKEPQKMTQTNATGRMVSTNIYSTEERKECVDDAVREYFESSQKCV
ncbi:hypothetical protein [Pleurochrysis sp. endemic virus 1a]|nr:hypothetical protein [Pleurochrysis sp. endemic virus 1a]AUL80781.1 hypothetical protein [Pleurochrysis sp. endemic virus 1b]|mmetsp:Transcript_29428/g.64444  ORF Transcript_29428/g.64444 Transcript_29428/m.64444 type:complete len:319 (+) Transcript_29428:5766-6722(+)